MAFDASTDTAATTLAAGDKLPFGDVSANGGLGAWDTITAAKGLKALADVTDDLPGVLASLGLDDVLTATSYGATLWVSSAGNNSTAVRGRIDKPFLTYDAAVAAATAGDVIRGGPGTFASLSAPLTKANLTFLGSAKPSYDSFSTPTALVGGTVVRGNWVVQASGTRIGRLGIDCGSAYLGGGAAVDGLTAYGASAVKDLIFQDIAVLCKAEASTVHCVLVEGDIDGVRLNDIDTRNAVHGCAIKCRNVFVRQMRGADHGQDNIVVKADPGQVVTGIDVRGVQTTGLGAGVASVVLMGSGGTLDRVLIADVDSDGGGVDLIGTTAFGTMVLRNIFARGGFGAVTDRRTDTVLCVLDMLDMDGIHMLGSAGTAPVQVGVRCTRAKMRNINQSTSNTWGSLVYGEKVWVEASNFNNSFYIWPGSGGYTTPKVRGPAGSNEFLAGRTDTGGNWANTDF